MTLLSTETDRFDIVDNLNLLNFDEQFLGLIDMKPLLVHRVVMLLLIDLALFHHYILYYLLFTVVQLSLYELLP